MKANSTGTVTIGIACKDGVVLGTDKRASYETFIASKTAKKLYPIRNHMALTIAGLAADGQMLARWLNGEAELYYINHNIEMPIKSAATLFSNVMNQYKFTPFYVQLLMGGIDNSGNHIMSLDMAGGLFEDKYIATGSGSPYAYGILEDQYRKDMDCREGMDIVKKGINIAMKRDSAVGDGIDIAVITKEGIETFEF